MRKNGRFTHEKCSYKIIITYAVFSFYWEKNISKSKEKYLLTLTMYTYYTYRGGSRGNARGFCHNKMMKKKIF